MHETTVTTRQHILILISQLIVLEILVGMFSYLFKIPVVLGYVQSTPFYTAVTLLFHLVNVIAIVFISLRWANTQYRIENGSLVVQRGILAIREKTYALDNVESVEVLLGVYGRMFGYGTVDIYSPLFTSHVFIMDIPDPAAFAKELKKYIPSGTRVTVAPKR